MWRQVFSLLASSLASGSQRARRPRQSVSKEWSPEELDRRIVPACPPPGIYSDAVEPGETPTIQITVYPDGFGALDLQPSGGGTGAVGIRLKCKKEVTKLKIVTNEKIKLIKATLVENAGSGYDLKGALRIRDMVELKFDSPVFFQGPL